MAANPNWARWIKASVAKYLTVSVATPHTLPFLVEGVHERTQAFTEASDRAEGRVNGPFCDEESKNYWRLDVNINVLVISNMDGNAKNIYTLDTLAGYFLEAMSVGIPIYRIGNLTLPGSVDDGSLLGCLSPRTTKSDSIKILHFGQIQRTDRVKECMVDARYKMWITTT